MTTARMLQMTQLDIQSEDWNDPKTLDAILFGKRLLRSDSGMKPDEHIIVADISDDDVRDLEDISAAIALQRAIMCVMTSEAKRPTMSTICDIVGRVETRSDLHDVLLAAEIFRCRENPVIARPPETVHRYKEGTMTGLMRRALDAMDPETYGMEALAVACSLCSGVDLLEHIDPTITLEIRPANGEAFQPGRYQLAIRNNLAWLAKNSDADEERTGRYLKAYGTSIEKLGEILSQ